MVAREERRDGAVVQGSSALVLGVVLAAVGIWLLAGDVQVGALSFGRSVFFGAVALALAAGLLSLAGGTLTMMRAQRVRGDAPRTPRNI